MLFFLTEEYVPGKYKQPEVSEFIKLKRIELYKELRNEEIVAMLISYVAGERKFLSFKNGQNHKTLNLYHLFTPSGIHFSAIYLFLYPLILLFKNRKWVKHSFSIVLCSIPFFLDGLYSMKRVALYRIIKITNDTLLKDKIKLHRTPFVLFLITFFLDFFIGTYSYSPLSFVYSFLFLGIIFSFINKNKLALPFALLGGQIIISYFQNSSLPVLGFVFGFLLTSFFSLLFPLWFIYFFIPWPILTNLVSITLKLYFYLVNISAQLSLFFGNYYSTIPLILLVILLSMKIDMKIKTAFFLLTILITSDQITNLSNRDILVSKKYQNINLEKEKITKIKNTVRGIRVTTIDQKLCLVKLYNNFQRTDCDFNQNNRPTSL